VQQDPDEPSRYARTQTAAAYLLRTDRPSTTTLRTHLHSPHQLVENTPNLTGPETGGDQGANALHVCLKTDVRPGSERAVCFDHDLVPNGPCGPWLLQAPSCGIAVNSSSYWLPSTVTRDARLLLRPRLKAGSVESGLYPPTPRGNMRATLAVALVTVASNVLAQGPTPPDSNSYPHDYPGKPSGDYSPAWQSCVFDFISFMGFVPHACARL
jgi:hypothetical protein